MPQKVTDIEVVGGLSYTLRRSRRRTIAVEIHPHGELVVRAPLRTSLAEIEGFLTSRRQWITARLAEYRVTRSGLPRLSEGSHYLFGEVVSGGLGERRRREALHRCVQSDLDALLPALGVSALRYRTFGLRKLRRRWGSCRADGVLTFNEHLVMVPPRCITAVVAHELAHLVHLHHGPEFYRLVREIMPDYDEADRELDTWTSVLNQVTGKTNNGARGPVEQRTIWFDADQADAPAQISLNADLSESAIISGVRPSMW